MNCEQVQIITLLTRVLFKQKGYNGPNFEAILRLFRYYFKKSEGHHIVTKIHTSENLWCSYISLGILYMALIASNSHLQCITSKI